MALIDVTYQPGTHKLPEQTSLSKASFTDTSGVHFPDGRLRNLPANQDVTFTSDYVTFGAGCRAIFSTKLGANTPQSFFLFGTNSKLYCALNNILYNITPLVTSATATLGTDPIDTTNTSTTITITYTSHNLAIGDRIKLSGATDVGGITAATYINIEHIVATVPTANTFTVVVGTAATSTATGSGGS